jgi:DNA-directed RNA polymerase subunit H (RpoH/RPB5)
MENKAFKLETMQIRKSDESLQKEVLINLIKYMLARKVIEGDVAEYFDPAWKSRTDENVFKIFVPTKITGEEKSAEEIQEKNGGCFWMLKIIQQTVKSLKSSNLNAFLEKHRDLHKVIAIRDYTPKAEAQIRAFHNTEVFREPDLLMNLLEYFQGPLEYQILTPQEQAMAKEAYDMKLIQMGIMKESDAIAQALKLNHGEIIRVVRPAEGSGKDIKYIAISV